MADGTKVFRHRYTSQSKWFFLVMGLLFIIVAVSPDDTPLIAKILFLAFGFAGIWTGIVFFRGARFLRAEMSEEGLKLFSIKNKVTLDAPWSQITEYVRKPSPLRFLGDGEPCWQISVGMKKAWIPHLTEHAAFQREMFHRIPKEAIPDQYRNHGSAFSIDFELPIKQFSLIADERGLVVDSALNRAKIAWEDVLYIEELHYLTDGEGEGLEVPRIYICSATDCFRLTRTWDRYEDIRRLALAKAPPTAIVILADDRQLRSFSVYLPS